MVLVCMTQDVSPFCQYSDLVVMVRVALQDVAQSATTANAVRPQARLAVRPALPVRPRPMPLLDCFFIIVFLFSVFIVPDVIGRSLYVHSAALYAAFLRPFHRHCMPVLSSFSGQFNCPPATLSRRAMCELTRGPRKILIFGVKHGEAN